MKKVLLLEDNQTIGKIQELALTKEGAIVTWVKNVRDATLTIVNDGDYCMYFCDGAVPQFPDEDPAFKNGIQFMERLIEREGISVEKIICTSSEKIVIDYATEKGIRSITKEETGGIFQKRCLGT